MAVEKFQWNEYIIETLEESYRVGSGLAIFATVDDGILRPVGSGFVISASGSHAVVCTAAHNLIGILQLQSPPPRSNRTALPEFMPVPKPLDISGHKLRVICFEDNMLETAIIERAYYDENADIAIVYIRAQKRDVSFFKTSYPIDSSMPKVGEEIMVLGRTQFDIFDDQKEGGKRGFKMSSKLRMRRGYVKAIYPQGHLLCRGPCVETTIPVFGGMSGGPVMRVAAVGETNLVFGLVSSDPEGETDKDNRHEAGALIVALLPIVTSLLSDGKTLLEIRLQCSLPIVNTELVGGDTAT